MGFLIVLITYARVYINIVVLNWVIGIVITEDNLKQGFALQLEGACRSFSVLQSLIRNEFQICSTSESCNVENLDANIPFHRAGPCIQMALAQSFLFSSRRALRICEHGAGKLNIDRAERKQFLAALGKITHVRDVNEHGFDASGKSRPSGHTHDFDEFSIKVDETSLSITSDTMINMGPLNLYDVYLSVEKMRKIAGFSSLREIDNIEE